MAEKKQASTRTKPANTEEKRKTRSRRGFKLKHILWILIALIILGIAFLFTAKPVFNINLREKLQRNKIQSGSAAILQKMDDLFLFQSVEYVYKTVFPYDYVSADYDWRRLLDMEITGNPLTEEQKNNLELFRFCEEIGMNLLKKDYQFVVVTTIIRGGFDLENTPFENPEEFPDPEEYISIDEEEKILYLRMPPPVITDFEIEDLNTETYAYPDIEISPENYKRLVDFISLRVETRVLEDGILELALERGRAFMEKILLDAGLKEIVFM